MKSSIQAAIFQFPVVQADPDHNLNYIYQNLKNKNADLILLPELCTTGYFLNSDQWRRFSDPHAWDVSMDLLMELARISQSHLLFTLPKMIANRLYNIAYLINEEGILGAQAKIHIPERERGFFSPNPIKRVEPIPTDFGRVGILSCLDLWNSSLVSQLKSEKIDLACIPTAFTSESTLAIDKSAQSELSVPMLMCNRIGKERSENRTVEFAGKSSIWNEKGKVMAQTKQDESYLSLKLALPNRSELPFGKDLEIDMHWN